MRQKKVEKHCTRGFIHLELDKFQVLNYFNFVSFSRSFGKTFNVKERLLIQLKPRDLLIWRICSRVSLHHSIFDDWSRQIGCRQTRPNGTKAYLKQLFNLECTLYLTFIACISLEMT